MEYEYDVQTTKLLKQRFEDALKVRIQQVQALESTPGPRQLEIIKAWDTLGSIYRFKEQPDQSMSYFRKAYQAAVDNLGIDDRETIEIRNHLEKALYDDRRDLKALTDFRRKVLEHYNSTFGPLDLRTLNRENEFLLALNREEKFEEMIPVGEQLLQHLNVANVGGDLLKFAKRKVAMALAIVYKKKTEESRGASQANMLRAASLMEDSLLAESQGGDDKSILMILQNLRDFYTTLQDWPKALEKAKLAVAMAVQVYGDNTEETLQDRDELLPLQLRNGDDHESLSLAIDIYNNRVAVQGYENEETVIAAVGMCYVLLRMDGSSEEDFINVFRLVWTIFQKLETGAARSGCRSYSGKEEILDALGRLKRRVSPNGEARMEEIRHSTLVPSESEVPANQEELTDKGDIVAYAQKVLNLDEEAPKTVTSSGIKPVFPTEGKHRYLFFSMQIYNLSAVSSPTVHSETSYKLPEQSSDDDSSLLDRIDALEAKENAGEARWASDEPSDEEMLYLAGELKARRYEEMFARSRGFHNFNSFENWFELPENKAQSGNSG